ncbi:acyl--CoA ligase [Rhodobacteraceae bacterium NNCM2]|nr:acyl--CoA ligase [Coraliihabitans acroporae]
MSPLTTSLFDIGPPPPCPASFNMARYVMEAGRATPEKTALLVLTGEAGDVAERWTFAALDRAIRGTAAGLLSLGLERGDRVALRMGNLSDFPILFFGTIAAGGIAVPTSSQLTEREFHKVAADMRPRFVAVAEDLELEHLPDGANVIPQSAWAGLRETPPTDFVETGADDPAFLIYTSGTSGSPKGVLHAQRAAWARRMMWKGWYDLSADDVMLHAGAFNWTYTLGTGLTDPWAAGATSLIHIGALEADWLPNLARRHGATIMAAVPGVYRRILRGGRDLRAEFSALRHGLTAGERMPDSLAEAWRGQTGTPVFEALGMSEISTYLSTSPTVPPRKGASGRPQAGRRVAILDGDDTASIGTPGDIAISNRDPGLMLGYWHRPEETASVMRGEWFVTGDRGAMDVDGYVTYLGRSDDVMTSLGYRVSPQEVEEVLATHPAIAEVGVTEVAVREDLTLIAAFVVPNGDWPGDEAMADFAAERLATYKLPKLWIERETLPRTANGKLVRRDLAASYGGKQQTPS